jgi:hypothetical protein
MKTDPAHNADYVCGAGHHHRTIRTAVACDEEDGEMTDQDVDTVAMDKNEWRRQMMQGWCPGPVHYEGHLLPCSLADQHEGECNAKMRDVVEHRLGGQKECVRCGCGLPQFDGSDA